MTPINREPARYSSDKYDLVIIGGGIQGAVLLLESAVAGLRTLLLEKNDFGSRASWNGLRILHGGFRYLQSLNLVRLRDSVRSRSWFLSSYPGLTRPLTCYMPLYDRGLKRPSVMRTALALNDMLSARRNRGLAAAQFLECGRVVSSEETLARVPFANPTGLNGAAVWIDGVVDRPSRVLIETLLRARSAGGRALNYVEAERVVVREGRVRAVETVDKLTGARHRFSTARVALCIGPAPEDVRCLTGVERPDVAPPSLAWNLAIRKPLPLEKGTALAAAAPASTRFLFVHNQGRLTLAGTGHDRVQADVPDPSTVSEAQISRTLADLNAAIPGWDVARGDVARVLSGLVPAERPNSNVALGRESVWHARGEAHGLFGLNTVKYTTSVSMARKALRAMGLRTSRSMPPPSRQRVREVPEASAFLDLAAREPTEARAMVTSIMRTESVQRPRDLVLYRADWGLDPEVEEATLAEVERLLKP